MIAQRLAIAATVCGALGFSAGPALADNLSLTGVVRDFKRGDQSGGHKDFQTAGAANKFGHVSPTTAQHVRDEFGADRNGLLNCILEGGQSEVGIESTIVDLSRGRAVLLRPGQISAERIAEVLGEMPGMPDAEAPRASGRIRRLRWSIAPCWTTLCGACRNADGASPCCISGRMPCRSPRSLRWRTRPARMRTTCMRHCARWMTRMPT